MRRSALLAFIILLPGIVTYAWYLSALRPVNISDDARHSVLIEQGMSTDAIAQLLTEEELIRSPLAFKVHARLSGAQGLLKAGSYVLQRSFSIPEMMTVLSEGKAQEMRLTIPEGYTVSQIDALLAEERLIEPGAFIECARSCALTEADFLPGNLGGLADRGGRVEGYLYPDTYFVVGGTFTSEAFMGRLLSTFRIRVIEEHGAEIEASGRSLHEIVTMASLVEAETRKRDERPVVSGILWKRYEAEMGLGVDATVRYILDKPTDTITRSDLDIDSPYNTRKYRGLPPGPIENPGIQSILAALRPEVTAYWYYLHAPSGMIHYAETNDEHNRNRARYL